MRNCYAYLYVITVLVAMQIHCDNSECIPPTQTFLLTDEARCVNLNLPGRQINITNLGTSAYYYMKDRYTFYFPNISFDCQCTCRDYKGLCSSTARTRQENCDNYLADDKMCANFFFERSDSAHCPLQHKVCCQTYFSVYDPREKFQAVQIDRWRTSFDLEVTSSKDAVVWSIPDWVTTMLLSKDVAIDVIQQTSPKDENDLSDRWIYFNEETQKFYTDVEVNDKGELNFDKLGWFQANDNNKIQKLPKYGLEKYLRMKISDCRYSQPTFSWSFQAVNYYHGNTLYSIKKGIPMSEVYNIAWLTSKTDFFDIRPALVLKRSKLPKLMIKINGDLPVSFAAYVSTSATQKYVLTLHVFRARPDNYDVVVGFVEYIRTGILAINESHAFPYKFRFKVDIGVFWNLTCLRTRSHQPQTVCVPIKTISTEATEFVPTQTVTLLTQKITTDTSSQLTTPRSKVYELSNQKTILNLIQKNAPMFLGLLILVGLFILLFIKMMKNQENYQDDTVSGKNVESDVEKNKLINTKEGQHLENQDRMLEEEDEL